MRPAPAVLAALLILAGGSAPVWAAQKPAPGAPAPQAITAPTAADWRTPDPQDILVIDTNKGRILVELAPLAAPNHVARLRELTRKGLYDGRSFFRVIDAFMAQTGDPEDRGTGGSDLPDLAAEFTFRRGAETPFVRVADQTVAEIGFIGSLPVMTQSSQLMPMTADGRVSGWALFCPGVAGMARGGAPDSANSQFFLMRQAYPSLEKRYTAFGRVISGLEVVRAIKTGEPVDPPQDVMIRVQVLADMPASSRPRVRVIETRGAWFAAEIARVRASLGADFTACAISIPSEVK
ncbi:MAG: peptidylprolyl isomerase [Phenylobacterium sp.]|uniref:peptidylprolyl isomerase n=1 Tax=Phenylobacterium sp. TaxID=1871053 RepID=UPI0025F058FC|nr:peptidylprolyl isomerase [Phenylobacterium sp.]MCA3735793.1 peptidylprolyl isomerase [Phenylobacterium sp.]MCA3751078.1 peptidylprolyl isomerase [Phenylobacterium sp.]MCA3756717.1 peptidylprolyl isomerase [Phenylobacterium sp.]MCA6236641.1 peptidylprolyl isomerase [Phenylobacterium sp.]MCA6241375.1 peptidylprolyl isomerase [Phenylobacterium sp.]